MGTFSNGANTPLNTNGGGSLPQVGGAMQSWFQPLVFVRVTKTIEGYQTVETAESIDFRGVIQPYNERKLMLRPEGQQAWTWYTLHAEPTLVLEVDEVVIYQGVQTRVMTRKDFKAYGYVEYSLVQDYTGAGPIEETP